MQKLVWQNANGVELDLTSGNYGITEWEGFSNASLNIQQQQVPFQDGGVFLDALIEQRELSVTLAMQDNNNLELRYQNRRELISALNPKLGEGYLIYTNDFISKRIKCVPQIPLFETHNSDTAGTPKASLSWTACNPYWEDLEETEIIFDISKQPEIENKGDIPAQLKINWFTNYVKNGKLTNITTDKMIKYNGVLNKSIQINTNIGQKEIVSNVLNYQLITTGEYIHSIVYSKKLNLFVAVGNNGTVYISKDCEKWEIVYINTTRDFYTVTYSEKLELFVIGESRGTGLARTNVLTSTDGKIWTEQEVTNYYYDILSIVYSESLELFVAVCTDGKIFTSVDGVTWTQRTSGVSTSLTNVIYNTEMSSFVVVGASGVILTSSDGINWTQQNSGVSGYLISICYSVDLNLFVVVGTISSNSPCILTSTNLTTWTQVSNLPTNTNSLYSIAYSSEQRKFVTVGVAGTIMISYDGVNWERILQEQIVNNLAYLIYTENYEMFTIVGNQGDIYTSVDGKTLTPRIKSNATDINDIIYNRNKNIFLMAGNYSVNISTDGFIWERVIFIWGTNFNSICYSENLEIFVVVSNKGQIFTSADGRNWEEQTSGLGSNTSLNDVIYSESVGLFIITGASGTILTSSDGINWSSQNSSVSENLNSIAYSEEQGLFVVVGNNGTIIISQDGQEWSLQTTNVSQNLNNVIYFDVVNFFIAVGNNGTILTSYNGIVWFIQNEVVTRNLYGLAYSRDSGTVFVVGGLGTVLTSADGRNWEEQSVCNNNLRAVCCGENTVFIGGSSGLLIEVSFIVSENVIQNITNDSDVNLNLEIGKNVFRINKEEGNMIVKIKYRQKYIGV